MYWSLKSAEANPDESLWQRQAMLEKFQTHKGKSTDMSTLRSQRSFEPHQAFARELGFLEKGERWRITSDVGHPFLRLWDEANIQPPKFIVLAQLLSHDRSMTIPFIRGILKRGKSEGPEIIAKIWDWFWKKFPLEMEIKEPPLPKTLRKNENELKRTCNHHSMCRLRILTKPEGLNLDEQQLQNIYDNFKKYEFTKMPADFYSKISFAIYARVPEQLDDDVLLQKIKEFFPYFKTSLSYASATAIYHYINNIILPDYFVDWQKFLKFIRTSDQMSLQSGFEGKDILLTIKGRKIQ